MILLAKKRIVIGQVGHSMILGKLLFLLLIFFLLTTEHRKHVARHKNEHVCNVGDCTRGFATINDLDRHKVGVHKMRLKDTRIYRCFGNACKNPRKDWPRKDNFKSHLRKTHSNEDEDQLLRQSELWWDSQLQEDPRGYGQTQPRPEPEPLMPYDHQLYGRPTSLSVQPPISHENEVDVHAWTPPHQFSDIDSDYQQTSHYYAKTAHNRVEQDTTARQQALDSDPPPMVMPFSADSALGSSIKTADVQKTLVNEDDIQSNYTDHQDLRIPEELKDDLVSELAEILFNSLCESLQDRRELVARQVDIVAKLLPNALKDFSMQLELSARSTPQRYAVLLVRRCREYVITIIRNQMRLGDFLY